MPTLDWLNRTQAFASSARVPYRLLEPVSEHGQNGSDNLLIQGDNLEALKALLPFYRGQVKCIFIDPPYNTRSAFEHYDDNLEHSQWLSMMLPRLQLLRELLRDDGSIWVTIDDNEGHYLKVLMDEVFGRGNFVADVIWQKKYAVSNDSLFFSSDHDLVLVYAKNKNVWIPNRLPRSEKSNAAYKNPDQDTRGAWQSDNYTCNKSIEERPNLYYGIVNPTTGEVIFPKKTAVWRYSQERHAEHLKDGLIYWGAEGKNSVPRFKRFLSSVEDGGSVPSTIWNWQDAGHNQDAKREQLIFDASSPFTTPKPEKLLQRILHIASNESDLILDSFLGSGTTAAVAHKMRRRWIGIEMGEHAATHCLPRLQKVIDGEQGGISQTLGWHGGGGFRFLKLGETVFDEAGRIRASVRFAPLAAFIWQQETREAYQNSQHLTGTPHLGIFYREAAPKVDDLPINHENSNDFKLESNSEFDSASRTFHGLNSSNEPLKTAPNSSKQPVFALYLLYNGILGDKRPQSGNVLTSAVLEALLALHENICTTVSIAPQTLPLLVYGEACRLGTERLQNAQVTFKHIPHDVRAG